MDVSPVEHIDDPDLLARVHSLLDLAYEGDFAPEDWEHAIGGTHFLGFLNDELIAHGAVVSRLMDFDHATIDVGYVEAIAVHPDHQGQGFGATLMRAITEYCESTYDVSMLSTGEHDFYARLGWKRFLGESYVRTADGIERTADEDDGLMLLLADTHLALLTAKVTCEDRSGDAW